MSVPYEIKFTSGFMDDIQKFNKKEKEIILKQIKKIKHNPMRFKRLHGRENCYRVRIGYLRLVYYLEGKIIWFLIVEKRSSVYAVYLKRLYELRQKIE